MSKDQSDHSRDDITPKIAPKVDRRSFLKGAATGAAALAVNPGAQAQEPSAYQASFTAPSYQPLQRGTG